MSQSKKNVIVNLLLVEDHLPDIVLTKKAFYKCDAEYHIHVARDGEQALQFLHKKGPFAEVEQPDLILLDINLPKKSGYEVLQEIRNSSELQALPVIVLSSSTAEQDRLQSYRLFANSFIVKPSGLAGFIEMAKHIEGFWFKVGNLKN